MKRTLENCRIIKRLGQTIIRKGKCEGFGISEINNETLLAPCAKCPLNTRYEKPKPKRKRKFTWDAWDFDCDGTAYIIAKDECPNRVDVPEYIVNADGLPLTLLDGNNPDHISIHDVKWGWCKYQVRTDWENGDGEPMGGYIIEEYEPNTQKLNGKRKPGWFPVWILRKGEWY